MPHDCPWFLVKLAGPPVAVARLDGRWSVAGPSGGRSADSLQEAYLASQRGRRS
ncbi:MAG: hypothetical protein ACXVZN_05215 [Gaiellaceae bacterium]